MFLLRVFFLAAVPLAFLAGDLCAEKPQEEDNWTEFRNGGVSRVSGNLPLTWSPDKGIIWEKELPGYGQSTPVIFQGRVFVASVIGDSKEECCLSCYHLQTGVKQWSYRTKSASQAPSNYAVARAAPTPVVDNQGVVAFFEGGDLLAFSLDGEKRWHRNLATDFGPFKNHHGLGSSPTQTDDLVFLNLEHDGPSALVAFDKKTGETIWKVDRPSGKSWTSPIIVNSEDVTMLVLSSAGTVTAYNASSGKQLWQLEGLEGNSVPSPTFDGKHLLVGAREAEFGSTRDAAKSNLCLQISDKRQDILWRAEKVVSHYSSPVITDSCAYYVSKVGILTCLDLATGKRHYQKRIGLQCWTTPLVAQGHIYFFGKDGKTIILKSGPTFEEVAVNFLWNEDDPPKPETYVESQGGRGHGHGIGTPDSSGKKQSGESSRGGGMLKAIQAGDANKDGLLTEDEFPESFRRMFSRIDLNKDGKVDQAELEGMVKSFRKRREGSREGARDPIVYGIAASKGTIIVRTGTRLFAITQSEVADR